MGVRIEYKTAHEAEAVDVGWRRPVAPAPAPDAEDDIRDLAAYKEIMRCGTPPEEVRSDHYKQELFTRHI